MASIVVEEPKMSPLFNVHKKIRVVKPQHMLRKDLALKTSSKFFKRKI